MQAISELTMTWKILFCVLWLEEVRQMSLRNVLVLVRAYSCSREGYGYWDIDTYTCDVF